MEMLKVTGLSKSYGKIKALKSVSFSAKAGEVIGYIGPNGSGKTTTIRIITGVCSPDSGLVRIMNVNALKDYVKIGKKVAVIFENHGIYSYLTAWENLEFYARLINMPVNVRKIRIKKSLEMLGLIDRRKSLAKTFSKGMLRKLAIGRALLTEPQILILDEPFDGIDVSSRLFIMDLLKTWIKEENHCILLSSHNMYEVEELCDKIIILKQGEIVASGSMELLQKNSEQDLIEITLVEHYEHKLIQKVLSEFEQVHSFTLDGKKLLLAMDGQDISCISSFLHENGIGFGEIFNKHERLNEVYLRLVGHHEHE